MCNSFIDTHSVIDDLMPISSVSHIERCKARRFYSSGRLRVPRSPRRPPTLHILPTSQLLHGITYYSKACGSITAVIQAILTLKSTKSHPLSLPTTLQDRPVVIVLFTKAYFIEINQAPWLPLTHNHRPISTLGMDSTLLLAGTG